MNIHIRFNWEKIWWEISSFIFSMEKYSIGSEGLTAQTQCLLFYNVYMELYYWTVALNSAMMFRPVLHRIINISCLHEGEAMQQFKVTFVRGKLSNIITVKVF